MPGKVAIIYYSMYGHVATLAKEAAKGAESTGAKVDLYQFPETLPEEVLAKMYAAPKSTEVPVITPDALKEYDGIIFAFPTRYGRAVSQVSAFFDATGQLWMTGALVGKFASTITSTAGLQGGQETTHLTTVPFFTHHGMMYVPIGYSNPALQGMDEIHGGSPWGASTFAKGDGSRLPTATELGIAEGQGKLFANVVNTFVAGKAALASQTTAALTVPASAQAEPKAEPASAENATKEAGGYNVDTPAAASQPAKSTAAPATKKTDDTVGEAKGWKKYVCC